MRQLEEGSKSLHLLDSPPHHLKRHTERLRMAISTRQTDIKFHFGFKLLSRFQSSRESSIIDIAQWRHVIITDPRPEPVLPVQKHRLFIQHLLYRFHLKSGLLIMHFHRHTDILLAPSQGYKQALAKHNPPFHSFRNRIGKQAWKRQRKYHIYVFHNEKSS